MRILLNGKELDDEKTLDQHNITNGSSLILVLQPPQDQQ